MGVLLPEGKQSFTTNGSLPLAGGKVYTYVPGTSTPKDTYTTSAGTVVNTNPVILDSRGEAAIFWDGAYDVVLKDSSDVTIWGPIRHVTPELAGAAAEALADLADTASSANGAALVGYNPALSYSDGIGEFLNYSHARTAREIAAGVTPTNYQYPQGDVRRYGADPTGTSDSASAIDAADTVACAGTLGFDGSTVLADWAVYFPPGTYRVNSSLTYRGAPWRGAGIANTKLKYYGSSGPLINAVGATSARKLLSISDMSLDGGSATGTAYGLRLGHNYRSFGALQRVRIDYFPGPGIGFVGDSWNMSFHDVYMSFNADASVGTALYIDAAVTGLLAIDWFNLQLENNGFTGSSVAGGMELPNSTIINWNFYGGVWEGNYGDCEVRFTDCSGVHIYGTYLESNSAHAINGMVLQGNTRATISGLLNTADAAMAGKAIQVRQTANVSIDQVRGDNDWATDLSVEDTAVVTLIGEGSDFSTITVAAGASLKRTAQKRTQLTDAATIAMDASQGTSFYVTLGGNRTMGTPTNPTTGQRITVTVYQDGTGGRTMSWNGTWNVTWSNTGNTASKRSVCEFEYDGTYWNQVSAQSPYV